MAAKGIDTSKKNAGLEIKPCSCKHVFQDKQYGKGQRVKNRCSGGYRCTVCGVK